MKVRAATLLQNRLRRYILTGGSVYVLELVVIVIAQYLGANSILAVALSFWIGLAASFIIQKLFTFGDKRLHHRVLLPQVIAFSALVLFNFGFTILATRLLAPLLPATVVRTLALGVTTLWNYYLYNTHIFKKAEPEITTYY